MVRVNIINPRNLSDQHLIAEYNEILMLASYIRKSRDMEGIPEDYCLGKGHMKFFKNKLLYLKKRHEMLKKEMKRRGFAARNKLSLNGFSRDKLGNWKVKPKNKKVIKKRLAQKIRIKPSYYRYARKQMPAKFFFDLIRRA